MLKDFDELQYKKYLVGNNIIGCSECITGCKRTGVGVGVEGSCECACKFSYIESIENC